MKLSSAPHRPSLSAKAADKEVEIALRYDPDIPTAFLGDVGRVRQIVTNIAGNAVKFTLEGHVYIDVTAAVESGRHNVEISISDSGIGIPSDRLAAIFNEFEQVENAHNRNFEGTGLGLAISRRLAGLMGGVISATSLMGKGSNFKVQLPLTCSRHKIAQPVEGFVDLSNLSILVVDDLELNRRILSERLKTWGISVKLASCGKEALHILDSNLTEFDVFILDYQMPGEDGESLARRIRAKQQYSKTPLIVLSSLDHSLSVAVKQEIGFCELLQKPVRSEQLRSVLTRILSTSATEDETPEKVVQNTDQTERKILIAEDNATNQLIVKSMLKPTNAELVFAENGQDAFIKFRQLRPNLILMDMSMPVMDGISATIEIRKFEKDRQLKRCPIVALTANALKEDQEKCFAAGMDGFLSKPIRKLELIETIKVWTD